MPRIFSVFMLAVLVGLGFQAFGAPTPAEHPKKLFIKDSRIFLPHPSQVYLRLTLTPEDNAPTYLLLSKSALEKGGEALPFNFEGHGDHTVLHPRTARAEKRKMGAKSTDVFPIMVDAKAPVIKLSFSDVRKVVRAKRTIFGKPVSITVSAEDGDSGLEALFASADENPFAPYNAPLSFDQDSFFSVNYYAVDNVGNASKPRARLFAIDLTPPETTHTARGLMSGDVLSPKARVGFSSKDEKAGVASISYKLDSGENTVYNRKKPVLVNKLDDGEHSLTYFAVDRVGNEEEPKVYKFYLDRIPPEVSHTIEGDQYQAKQLYVSGRSRISMTATDNRAGVLAIRYRLNKGKNRNYAEPFGLPKKGVNYNVAYHAVDKVQNTSKTTAFNVVLDIHPPAWKLKFEGEHYFSRKTHWVNSSTKIGAVVKDKLSGVKSYSYVLDQDNKLPTTEPFTIEKEGEHVLRILAMDNVNNETPERNTVIFVDMTPPEIFVHFSVKSIDGNVTTEEASGSFPRKSKLYLAATDIHAGVRKIDYKLDDGKTQLYRGPLRLTKTGNRTITVTSVDNVGNASSKTTSFTVTRE